MSVATLTVPPNIIHSNERIRADAAPTTVRPEPAPCRVVTLSAELRKEYDAYANASRSGTLFHTCGWLDAIRATLTS